MSIIRGEFSTLKKAMEGRTGVYDYIIGMSDCEEELLPCKGCGATDYDGRVCTYCKRKR